MIYTITLNPSLDYVLRTEALMLGEINRVEQGFISFGGKGINVSYILKQLHCDSTILGFIAGYTGDLLCQLLRDNRCHSDFIVLPKGMTRINVKISSLQETEINAPGPDIDLNSLERLYHKIDSLKDKKTTIVISGSVPLSMPDDTYEHIISRLTGAGSQFVIDTTGQQLLNTLKYHPFLVKPNHLELGELFGCECNTIDKIIDCAHKLQKLGAENVLVSRANEGAVLITSSGNIISCPGINVKVVNSSGSGDAMLAGFLAGYFQSNGDFTYAMRLAVASGSATAATQFLANRDDILSLADNSITLCQSSL